MKRDFPTVHDPISTAVIELIIDGDFIEQHYKL
jgi:hypothetical protein